MIYRPSSLTLKSVSGRTAGRRISAAGSSNWAAASSIPTGTAGFSAICRKEKRIKQRPSAGSLKGTSIVSDRWGGMDRAPKLPLSTASPFRVTSHRHSSRER